MARETTPALLTVAGGRLDMPLSRSYLVGREAGCDIQVEDVTCSRRHAQIFVGAIPEVVSVVDLGSHNGTLLNDERVTGRTSMKHGDRLQIGATVYLLSTSEREMTEHHLMDTGTIAHERLGMAGVDEKVLRVMQVGGRANSDIAGQLGAFGIIEVLQFLTQMSRSGTLHVAVADGKAKVEIRNGEVCAAAYRGREGFDALLALARKQTGVFWLLEASGPLPKAIPQSAAQLLFELCCALDEKSRASG